MDRWGKRARSRGCSAEQSRCDCDDPLMQFVLGSLKSSDTVLDACEIDHYRFLVSRFSLMPSKTLVIFHLVVLG
jgi:hypothetical protein